MSTMEPLPQPFYADGAGEGLFGWLHPAARPGLFSFGMVVCNPFGFEEVCAHRSLRQLASSAAAAGVPSLRFDYPGCGDSEGDDLDGQALARWVNSVHRAIDSLKAATGVSQVCLLGVRLGAMLAALAASERDDVMGLVAIAPVVRGRAYLRELTVLGDAGAAGPAQHDGLLESAGFALTRSAVAELGAVDLRKLAKPAAPRVLIIERDDMASFDDWATVLQSQGVQAQRATWEGYAAMMEDPQRAQVPQRIVDGVVGQLRHWQATMPAPPVAATNQAQALSATLVTPTPDGRRLCETAVCIDAVGSRMFGVLTRMEGAGAQPAVLMLNSGSVHHIGPNRLWVKLSREWAQRGVTVLRVDLSGIGDSPARPGARENVVYSSHASADIAAALWYLRKEVGVTECHAMGLCSGGYHALKAAMAGQDLASVLMVNPLTYHWKDGEDVSGLKAYEVNGLASKFRRQLLTLEPWKKLLQGQLDVGIVINVLWRRLLNFGHPYALQVARALRIPLDRDLARELAGVTRRGVQLNFVFSEQAPGYELLQREGGKALHRLTQAHLATLDFVPRSDHTFTRREARDRLIEVLEARLLAECKQA